MAVTAQEFFSDLQWLLIEPMDGGITFPSGLWRPEEMVASANRRQSEFLRRTEITAAWSLIPLGIGDGEVPLPGDYILTQEMMLNAGGTSNPLARTGAFQLDRLLASWQGTPGRPLFYADSEAADVLETLVAPLSSVAGLILLIYVSLGEALTNDPLVPTLFAVPDEATVPILFGVLADALKKSGRGEDLVRAQYCEQRFEEGIVVWNLVLAGVL